MNSDLPVSADALLAERARLEEELQSSEDWRELLRLKSRKDRGEPMSAVNTARLELVLIDALSQDQTFIRYKAVCVALERLIRGLPPFPQEKPAGAYPEDDLTQIRGITPSMARRLKALDVTSFAQIAAWRAGDIREISAELDIGKQISDQKWVEQAAKLATPAAATEEDLDDEPDAAKPEPPRQAQGKPTPPSVPKAIEEVTAKPGNVVRPFPVAPAKTGRVQGEVTDPRDRVAQQPASDRTPESTAAGQITEREAKPGGSASAPAETSQQPVSKADAGTVSTPAAGVAKAELPAPQQSVARQSPEVPETDIAPPASKAREVEPQVQAEPKSPSSPQILAPAFDASSLKPPRPLVITRASISHLPRHVPQPPPRPVADIANGSSQKPAAQPPSLTTRLNSVGEQPAAAGADTLHSEKPVQKVAPPAVPAGQVGGQPSSMSISEAIAYAAEVARQGQKPEPKPEKAAPPPSPAPAQAKPAPHSTVRYEPPKPSKASPPPPPVKAAPSRPAPVTNGAARASVAPPPLPADYMAQSNGDFRAPELGRGSAADASGQDAGFSKVEIEEATVEIVRKGLPASEATPRMVIRPIEREAAEDSTRPATPIGRFLKALTGNQT